MLHNLQQGTHQRHYFASGSAWSHGSLLTLTMCQLPEVDCAAMGRRQAAVQAEFLLNNQSICVTELTSHSTDSNSRTPFMSAVGCCPILVAQRHQASSPWLPCLMLMTVNHSLATHRWQGGRHDSNNFGLASSPQHAHRHNTCSPHSRKQC